jgi:hypothetical protein
LAWQPPVVRKTVSLRHKPHEPIVPVPVCESLVRHRCHDRASARPSVNSCVAELSWQRSAVEAVTTLAAVIAVPAVVATLAAPRDVVATAVVPAAPATVAPTAVEKAVACASAWQVASIHTPGVTPKLRISTPAHRRAKRPIRTIRSKVRGTFFATIRPPPARIEFC